MEAQLTKATRQHTRDHNSRLVLRTIYEYGEISRADLSRLTGLTRTTISEVVGDLIGQALVQEVGHAPAGVGRTPILLSVVDDSRQIVAVNLTSNELQGAVLNLRGEVRHRDRQPLADRDGPALLARLEAFLSALIGAASAPLLGIGISTPGLIDVEKGIVIRAVNFGWQDLPLRQLLQARFELPAYVANDSHTTAMAEFMFGRSQGRPNLAVIKVGQGIGAGVLLGGQLFYGDGYGAGEIGHVVVQEGGPQCKCGNRGCLETVANVTALVERAKELAAAAPESQLGATLAAGEPIALETVLRAYLADDAPARAAVGATGHYLAIGVASLVGVLNVGRIVIAGRLAPFGDGLRDAVREELARRVLPALAQSTEIDIVAQGPDTALLGAAALLLIHELGLTRLQRRDRLAA